MIQGKTIEGWKYLEHSVVAPITFNVIEDVTVQNKDFLLFNGNMTIVGKGHNLTFSSNTEGILSGVSCSVSDLASLQIIGNQGFQESINDRLIISARGGANFVKLGEMKVEGNNGLFLKTEGAIYFSSIAGELRMQDNSCLWDDGSVRTYNLAGLLSAYRGIFFYSIGSIHIVDNKGASRHGPIMSSVIQMKLNGEAEFANNLTKKQGGGIILCTYYNSQDYSEAYFKSVLSADGGNIVFRNNREFYTNHGGNLNAILIGSTGTLGVIESLNLRAMAGREIIFYDPIRNGTVDTYLPRISSDPSLFDKVLYELNKPIDESDQMIYQGMNHETTGTIRFSGEVADEVIVQDVNGGETEDNWLKRSDASKYVDISGIVTLYGGRLVIEHGITFGNREIDDHTSSFTVKGGSILEITGKSVLNANMVTVESGATFRNGSGARINAVNMDMSNGITVDFQPWLDDYDSGTILDANSLKMGGSMTIQDKYNSQGKEHLDFYVNKRWASEQRYMVFSLTDKTQEGLEGSFSGAGSMASGSKIVKPGFGYAGIWSEEWSDTDGDGTPDTVYAVWRPTGETNMDLSPELGGDSTLNSMGSSASNMGQMSDAALGQIGLNRYRLKKCANYWVTTLGDFNMQRTRKGYAGYDYNGMGYAVGADSRLCPDNVIIGVAFGNLFGKNKSRTYFSEIKQTRYIGMLYGGWLKELNPTNAINTQATASWGLTQNRQKMRYSDGGSSSGKWDNTSMRYTLRSEWLKQWENDWITTCFIGGEYDDVQSGCFTESGDRARHFGKGQYRNLAVPIGFGASKTVEVLNNRKWAHALELSYVPDVYRKNPEAGVQRKDGGFSWLGHGVARARHAGRAEYQTALEWNETWTSFAGYGVEWRKDAVDQRVNLGVSAKF